MQSVVRSWMGWAMVCATVACTTTNVENLDAGDGGSGASDPSSDPTACDVPDTTCPAERPHPGGQCTGALSCTYQDVVPWEFTCVNDTWEGDPDCEQIVGGCPVAPPAEYCEAPFTGSMTGTVSVGPADLGEAFRPFAAREAARIEWGGQGSAMIFYRVQLDGEDLPSCVRVKTTIAPQGIAAEDTTHSVVMRCGETLGMYIIVPAGDCSGSVPVPTALTVDVDGIGSTEVMLEVPPDAFCGGFG